VASAGHRSKNEDAFNRAVDGVAQIARELLDSLVTNAPVRDREAEAVKARERSARRLALLPSSLQGAPGITRSEDY